MTAVPRSIQGRITLGSVAIAAIVVALLAVLLGDQLRRVADGSIAALTRADLEPYVADLRNQPDEALDTPRPAQRVLVLSPQGAIAVDTLPPGIRPALERSGPAVSRTRSGSVAYLAVGETVTNSRGTWRLWAVREGTTADLTMQGFARVLLIAVPLVLLLVALGSWLLVRASLRPVRQLRTAAERIGSAGVPSLLPEGRGRDELAALTTTLNRFLDEQHRSIERERRMVAEASHELRTPLAVLTTQLELAHHDFGNAAALEETVRAAEANLGAVSRLATQLLELSELEAGEGAGHRHDTATVAALLSELMAAVDRARALAPEAVRVEFELAGSIDEHAIAPLTAVAFGRIVDNLAANAIRATPGGSVELVLDQRPDGLVLTVADTGSGVPPDFLERAFERFTRSDESRARGADGSGLGLALVQALIDAAGGEVTLANRPGGGAEAVARLPLVRGAGIRPSYEPSSVRAPVSGDPLQLDVEP